MRNGRAITDGADAIMDNHSVYRDGSVWACRYCKRTWPFPAPVPKDATPCTPRRWGDGQPPVEVVRAQPSALARECPRCGAAPGERCRDMRRAGDAELLVPHRERRRTR